MDKIDSKQYGCSIFIQWGIVQFQLSIWKSSTETDQTVSGENKRNWVLFSLSSYHLAYRVMHLLLDVYIIQWTKMRSHWYKMTSVLSMLYVLLLWFFRVVNGQKMKCVPIRSLIILALTICVYACPHQLIRHGKLWQITPRKSDQIAHCYSKISHIFVQTQINW
jgi:hypothetical protein